MAALHLWNKKLLWCSVCRLLGRGEQTTSIAIAKTPAVRVPGSGRSALFTRLLEYVRTCLLGEEHGS
jgi:hypothetical protein